MVLLLASITGVAQQQELITDRPDQSNSPVVIPVGALQIETGVAMEKDGYKKTKLVNYTFNNMLIKLGVNENFETQVGFSYVGIDSLRENAAMLRGWSPILVGAKIKLAQAKGIWPQTALIAHVALKSDASKLSPNNTGADITLAFANNLSKAIELVYNVGINWKGDSPRPVWAYTLSMAYKLTEEAELFIESYGFFPEGESADHRLDAGFMFKIRPMFQVDVSGGVGLSKKSPTYFLSTGLSFRLFK
jgi:hypothetical protein